MNCDRCQELLGDLLDGSITAGNRAMVSKHLSVCFDCVAVRDDLRAIISIAREEREEYVAPPNERALWLRIQNTLEGEFDVRRGAVTKAAVANQRTAATDGGWLARLANKRWQISLPQLTTAITMIIVAVSLVTTMALRSKQQSEPLDGDVSPGAMSSSVSPDPEVYVRHQRPAIEYWRHRVEQRKGRWNPRVREAFQRNMDVIDQTVNDSLIELRRHPHDDVSEEMLNAALRNKVELLQEFSEL